MSKVWIVTTGACSDYSINGIFSTEEVAREYHAALKAAEREANEVEEWEVDAPGFSPGYTPWRVQIKLDGTVMGCESDCYTSGPETTVQLIHYRPPIPRDTLAVDTWAKDSEHAIKIANEQRVGWILSHPS